jgi:hypothetical protein
MAYSASLNAARSIPHASAPVGPPRISVSVSAPVSTPIPAPVPASVPASVSTPLSAPGPAPAPASQAALAFAAIEPLSGPRAVAPVRFRRDAAPIVFTITHVGNSLDDLVGDNRVRQQLDKVVAAIQRMNVTEIDIKGYYPWFAELSMPRIEAVKKYLVLHGADERLVTLSPRGPGPSHRDGHLSRSVAVRIQLTGTPKATARADATSLETRREVLPPA